MTRAAPAPGSRTFSWGKALKHWLLAWGASWLVIVLIVTVRGTADSPDLAYALGALGPKLLLPATVLSYLVQTGRRAWVWSIIAVWTAISVSLLLHGNKQAPRPPEPYEFFRRGCEAKCPSGTPIERCTALCECVWVSLRAAHPTDAELSRLVSAVGTDARRFEEEMFGYGEDCARSAAR